MPNRTPHTRTPFPHPSERATVTVRRLRDEVGPVAPIELSGGIGGWLATSYATVNEVLLNEGTLYSKDARHFTGLHDGTIPADWPLRQVVEADHMLNKDGQEHRRLRTLVNRAFTPQRVNALAPRIEEITAGLLDRLAAGDERADLVPAFTDPLPVVVICELFGVPEEERDIIRRSAAAILALTTTPEEMARIWENLIAFLTGFIERRRSDPRDDLTTGLIQAQEGDDRLTDDEILWILWLVILAGHETTVHLIANAVIALCADPAQLALAREKDAWSDVVEETLRARMPMSAGLFRYAMKDVRLAGVAIRAGEPVLVGFGGTGTDPARFGPDAARFDLARTPEPHLGFGRGPHFCLGAPLARLEARIALSGLFARFPGLRLAVPEEEIVYTSSMITEGPVSLPVLLRGT